MKTVKKAFILTQVKISENDRFLLKKSEIFKLAINQHAEKLKPDLRICTDYNAGCLLQNFKQKIVSTREYIQNERIIYRPDLIFKGSTIVSAIEFLINEKFKDILIVGDNTVNSDIFQKRVKNEIDLIKNQANIFQFSNGNFNLEVKNIDDFIKEQNNGIFRKAKKSYTCYNTGK